MHERHPPLLLGAAAFLVTLAPFTVTVPAVQGQPVPWGPDFQVDSYPPEKLGSPAVAALGDGFVVVWSGDGSPGGDIG